MLLIALAGFTWEIVSDWCSLIRAMHKTGDLSSQDSVVELPKKTAVTVPFDICVIEVDSVG